MTRLIDAEAFRTPQDLAVKLIAPQRILIIGSCLAESWSQILSRMERPCIASIYFTGHPLPQRPELPIEAYDFQLMQFALRFVLPDGAFARLPQHDLTGHATLFADCLARLRSFVDYAMRWNQEHGVLTFVMPFVVPQQNPMGRLAPRHDLRNPVYFIERLNEELEKDIGRFVNTFYFDFNEVLASFGKRHILEDQFMMFNHGSFMFDMDFLHDQQRLEPVTPATEVFDGKVDLILRAAWRELVAMYRTVRQQDQVKLVVLDLDDTLWRGVAAEVTDDLYATSEGWPRALWETCLFLKRRGVLLAIISKNDDSRVRSIWPTIFAGVLRIDDFAIVRINWAPKVQNMAEILAVVNVLPGSVLYIDDNPVERAALKEAYPDLRLLGGNPINWRRILISSAETQVSGVTEESAARTEMIKAQVRREADRRGGDHAVFLAALGVRVRPILVDGPSHPRFSRALELINKTNQFNTTGDTIEQFVMSCRVMGIGVEATAIAFVVDDIARAGYATARAVLEKTDRNLPCQDLFACSGFEAGTGGWSRALANLPPIPAHVTLAGAEELIAS